METVFDLEPSSTSSTPTSLVSQSLCPGTGQEGGLLAGVGYSSSIVGAPAVSTHHGYWGGDGGSQTIPFDAAGLGPGQISAVALAEEQS